MKRVLSAACPIFGLLVVSFFFDGIVQAQDSDERRERYERGIAKYVEALIKAYDKDDDGILQEDELEQMRRRPKGADYDKDGSVSREELIKNYLGAARERNRDGKRESSKRWGGLASSSPRQAQDGGGSSYGSVAKTKKNSKRGPQNDNTNETDQNTDLTAEVFDVSVFMFRGTDSETMSKLGKIIKDESRSDSERLLQEYAKTLNSDYDFDTLQFTVTWNQEFTLSASGRVPVVDSITRSRGSIQSSMTNYEVGTQLELIAKKRDGIQIMTVELEKSAVFDSDEVLFKTESGSETLAKQVSQINMNSTFPFSMNKASVVSMTDSGSTWVIVFVAEN